MIEIEKNVPVPIRWAGRSRIYPFPDMAVGDSFAIPLTNDRVDGDDKAAIRLRSSAIIYGKRHDCTFTVRVDRAGGVARCWRTA